MIECKGIGFCPYKNCRKDNLVDKDKLFKLVIDSRLCHTSFANRDECLNECTDLAQAIIEHINKNYIKKDSLPHENAIYELMDNTGIDYATRIKLAQAIHGRMLKGE